MVMESARSWLSLSTIAPRTLGLRGWGRSFSTSPYFWTSLALACQLGVERSFARSFLFDAAIVHLRFGLQGVRCRRVGFGLLFLVVARVCTVPTGKGQ